MTGVQTCALPIYPPVAQEKLNHLFTKIHNNHIADSDSNIDDDDNDEDDNNDDLRDENCE